MTQTLARTLLAVSLGLLISGSAAAETYSFKLKVDAGEYDRTNVPVRVVMLVPIGVADVNTVELTSGAETNRAPLSILAQLTKPPLLDSVGLAQGTARRQLHFILPNLKAQQALTLAGTLDTAAGKTPAATAYHWHDTPSDYAELTYGDRPVLRYMYKAIDETSKESREQTFKVFHHVYDPTGKQIVTKGPGGLYTHHRGLFFGFNRISYDDGKKKADTWHCTNDAFLSHEGFVSEDAGPVVGRQRVKIDWHGPGKEVFATEEREFTVYDVPGGTMIEFASRLRTQAGPVRLDGDPQHAGFHFRASNEVNESTKSQTYYIRPDGVGKPGETRNWAADGKGDKTQVNFPWKAMSFVLGNQRYTAAMLDKPTNPKEARFSERDYGRFGSYFEYDLTEEKPLELNYRVWLQAGAMTPAQVAALDTDFVAPPEVKILK
jgi:hypothetical protein